MEISVDVRENLIKARTVQTAPKKFFKNANKEKGWKSAFSFVIVTAFIGHVMTALYNLTLYPIIASNAGLGLQPAEYNISQILTAAIISYIATLAMSFIWGGALKVWLIFFKVDSTFSEAYKVMVYSRAPNYLLGWLPFVNVIAALYSFYLMLLALESQYELSRKKALIIIISSLVILFGVSFIAFSLLWQSSQF